MRYELVEKLYDQLSLNRSSFIFDDFKNCIFQTEQRNMKTVKTMDMSSETITVILSIFGLLMSNVVCISHHFDLQEDKVHHTSHLPLQPELVKIFEHCHKRASTFDLCIKNAFNELRVYFRSGKILATNYI